MLNLTGNYTFETRTVNSGTLKGVAKLILDLGGGNCMEIEGFKIIEGRNGLFVSPPSHKGTVTENGQQKEKWFQDVRIVGSDGSFNDAHKELNDNFKAEVLEAFNKDHPQQQEESQANAASKNAQTEEPKRKPLW